MLVATFFGSTPFIDRVGKGRSIARQIDQRVYHDPGSNEEEDNPGNVVDLI